MWLFTEARNVNRLLENHLGLNVLLLGCQMDNAILCNYTFVGSSNVE